MLEYVGGVNFVLSFIVVSVVGYGEFAFYVRESPS